MPTKLSFLGTPAITKQTLQRLCIRKKREDDPELTARLEALTSKPLTASQVGILPEFLPEDKVTCVFEQSDGILWLGSEEGLWRIDEKAENSLDKILCFRATAYMLDNHVLAIDGDGDNGVYVLTKTSVSHIRMKAMSLQEKALFHSEVNYKYIQRRGVVCGAHWDEKNNKWKSRASDNDGLWTGLVALGDICRYAVMRDDDKFSKEDVALARRNAMRWTEAVLLLSYIPSRKGKVPSFVRYNKPRSNRASDVYLLEGKDGTLNIPEKGPVGCVISSIGPKYPENWSDEGLPEIVFRNIEGYIARSYHVNDPENDPVSINSSVFFKKLYDETGKLISFRIPSKTEKGDDLTAPVFVDSSMDIPDRLRKLYTDDINPVTGEHWTDADIIYRCDTSNDELVAHYAIWQLAYDVFGEEDPELKEIIQVIASRHARHFTDNDYSHVDAGGQPTSWARMTREYYMNAFSDGFPDAPLGTVILLQLYKVAYHVTGDEEWNREYRKLALDEPYRYADLAAEHYQRYAMLAKAFVDDEDDDEQVREQVFKMMNYSDIRMAAVAYYTLFQLEKDEQLLEKYRRGADSWWEIEKYARDVEWSLVYQLGYTDRDVTDAFGEKCKDVLKWQLSHYPVSVRELYTDNSSRPDLREEDGLMWYKNSRIPCSLPYDEKQELGTHFFAAEQGRRHRALHESYNMIFPYWAGIYHGILKEEGKASDLTFDELMEVLNQE